MAKRQEYRLQALLEIRERKKEEAERRLGVCLQALGAAQARRREMEERLARMIVKRRARVRECTDQTMRGEMSARDAVSARLFVERLRREEQAQQSAVRDQEAVVARKEKEVQAARRDLLEASHELQALQRHREKWTTQAKKQRLAEQEETLDELAQNLFLNRDS